jgi:hypothetical protein
MKTKYISTYTLLFVLFIVSALSCGGDDDPTLQDLAFEKLSGSWDLSQGGAMIIDGQDASANFVGFAFSFTDGGYTTTNAGDLFRATGTWEWADEAAQQLNIDDGKVLTIQELTETQFVFSFTTNGVGGAANGIAGNYTITVNQ